MSGSAAASRVPLRAGSGVVPVWQYRCHYDGDLAVLCDEARSRGLLSEWHIPQDPSLKRGLTAVMNTALLWSEKYQLLSGLDIEWWVSDLDNYAALTTFSGDGFRVVFDRQRLSRRRPPVLALDALHELSHMAHFC